MTTEITTFNFEIKSLKEAMDYAKLIADSDLAPKDFKGKAGNVLIAIQMGMEIGLKPLQAIQNIAIINGRPCVWGDAMLALVQHHSLCEYIKEEMKGDVAYCTVKRKGEQEYTYSFSKDEAKIAGLAGKAGCWTQYPRRMLQMRARAFAIRDKFADVLKGIAMAEEVMDYQDADFKVVQSVEAKDLNESLGFINPTKEVDTCDTSTKTQQYDISILDREILDSSSMESLKENFEKNYKIVKENKDHLSLLTESKDKRKKHLEDRQQLSDELNIFYGCTGEIK